MIQGKGAEYEGEGRALLLGFWYFSEQWEERFLKAILQTGCWEMYRTNGHSYS